MSFVTMSESNDHRCEVGEKPRFFLGGREVGILGGYILRGKTGNIENYMDF
jgi:hypothetical protein